MEKLDSIDAAIADIRSGKMVIVVDDEDRENEGDLLMSAAKVTPESINFMAMHGRGLICAPIDEDLGARLQLIPMVSNNVARLGTNFTVSVDLKLGTTTGISASERAKTIKALSNTKARADDFLRPGHVFPLLAKKGGVLARAGHTEAAADLCGLAGLPRVGAICEIMMPNGEMARLPQLVRFAAKYRLKIVSIKDLIKYRAHRECTVEKIASAKLPTAFGDFKLVAFKTLYYEQAYVALVKGDVSKGGPVLTRVHSECLTGEAFHSLRCDCGPQLNEAMRLIEKRGRGVIIYMKQEGRGIGILNKIKAYSLQDKGYDTVDANLKLGFKADLRHYEVASWILKKLGVKSVELLTNNPGKIEEIADGGIKIVKRLPLEIKPNFIDRQYLKTKKKRLGHLLKHV
jgi:3,4-dihydroxy 2-butanone 4-phosphate synthase/GTP cyclohydrolase II